MLLQFLFLVGVLPFGQTTQTNEERTTISCCVFGFDFSTAADTCQYWDQCPGGYSTCIGNSEEAALCSQCLNNPTLNYCNDPITQSKKSRDLGHLELARYTTVSQESDLVPMKRANSFEWTLPNGPGTSTATYLGVIFNFIVNAYSEVYISIINDNGLPIIASLVDLVTGWSVREPLPGGASASYQQVNGAPGDNFKFTVEE